MEALPYINSTVPENRLMPSSVFQRPVSPRTYPCCLGVMARTCSTTGRTSLRNVILCPYQEADEVLGTYSSYTLFPYDRKAAGF